MQDRGTIRQTPDGVRALATIHPSAVLRAPDAARRREAYAMLVADLKRAATTRPQPAAKRPAARKNRSPASSVP